MEYLIFVMFVLGLIIIIKGGDIFVDAAVLIAKKLQIPELIIGATIVSLGTTFPEIAASVNAALQGQTEFALGNAIGSIDINTGFILAVLILLSNISLDKRIFRKKGLFLIFFVLLLIILSFDNMIQRSDGFILLSMLLLYFYITVKENKNNRVEEYDVEEVLSIDKKENLGKGIFKLILGAILVGVGAHILVENGIKIAEFFAVPPYIISLTLISFGTSLPELVTSIVALVKKHQSMSVGNIIGANILNIGSVIAFSAIVNPITVSNQIIYFDYLVTLILVGLSVGFALLYNGYRKYNGFVLFIIYIIYISLAISR
ncbi:MAG: calcium/sodium antiporter [bacterium]